MSILYTPYFGRLKLLRSSDVEENPEPKASRRSYCAVYANIWSMDKNLSDYTLMARGGGVISCSEALLSSRSHNSKLMVPGFGRPMLLFRGEVDLFRGLAVYVRDGFLAYRQSGYECGCYEVIVVRICSISHYFYAAFV